MKSPATGYVSRRLVLFGIIVCSALVGLEAWHEWSQRAADVRQTETAALNVARAVAREADATFRLAETVLFGITERLQTGGWSPEALERLSRSMATATRSLESVGGLFVYDAEGRWVASSLAEIPPGVNNADRAYFRFHKADPSLAPRLSEPIRSRSSGAWIILVSRRLEHPDGSFAGVAAATVDVERFVRRLSGFDVGPGGVIALLTREGRILARQPFLGDLIGRDMSASPLFRRDLPGQPAGAGRYVSPIDGNARLAGFATGSVFPVVAYAAISENEALADWRSGALARVAGMALLLAAVSGLGVKLLRDVRRRERAEGELAGSEARYRLLSEATTDMVTHLDLSGQRLYASPASRELLGYEPHELIGTCVEQAVHPDDAAGLNARLRDLKAGRCERAVHAYRLRHRDGHWVWVEASLKRLEDEAGRAVGFVASVRNIDARKADEAALLAAREEAERASAAKSEFLASMSHEIRTPLNGVIGYADLLLDDPGISGHVRQSGERIRSAGAALLTVVNDILDFSKIEAGRFEIAQQTFSPVSLVDNAVSIVRALAEAKGLGLRADLDAALPPWLVGDEDRLRQVLLNLMNNAIKFTLAGAVELRVTVEGGTDPVRLAFAVTDTGIGIPADRRDRLFRRFSQVDGSYRRGYGGTGLGLAISKSLVELMGGVIDVESEEGRGSTFRFELSLPRAQAPRPVAAETGRGLARRGRRLLLAEDVPLNQELARALLEAGGHAVDIVADGAEAVRAVQERHYDLVLMDVQMPLMDGVSATRRIRALAGPPAAVPIVALTANVLPQQVAEFRDAGMTDHVGKPFRRDELFAVIDRWAGSSAGHGVSGSGIGPLVRPSIDPDVLEASLFAQVEESFGHDRVGNMLALLATELSERFRSGESDREQLAYDAHAVTSAAGSLGFVGLSKLCREVEAAARAGADLEPLIRRLDQQREVTLGVIRILKAA